MSVKPDTYDVGQAVQRLIDAAQEVKLHAENWGGIVFKMAAKHCMNEVAIVEEAYHNAQQEEEE